MDCQNPSLFHASSHLRTYPAHCRPLSPRPVELNYRKTVYIEQPKSQSNVISFRPAIRPIEGDFPFPRFREQEAVVTPTRAKVNSGGRNVNFMSRPL